MTDSTLEPAEGVEDEPRARSRWPRIGGAVVLVVVLIAAARVGGGYIPEFARWVGEQGAVGLFVFVAGYALATVLAVPGSILTLAAGAIFGIGQGTALVFAGAMLGSTAAFLIARYLARPMVERRVASDPRFQRIDRAVAGQGWKIVGLLRLSPLLPFNLLNYSLGLTGVSLRDYVIGGFGMLPGTLLYVYSGKVAGELAVLAGDEAVSRGPGYFLMLGVGLLATIVVSVWVGRIAGAALADAA